MGSLESPETTQPAMHRGPLERLVAEYPAERMAATGALIIGGVAAGVAAVGPLIVRRLIDDAIPNRQSASINALALGLLVVPVIGALLAATHERRFEDTAHRVSRDLRERMNANDPAAAGAIEEVEQALASRVPQTAVASLTIAAAVIASAAISPLAALVACLGIPAYVAVQKRIVRRDRAAVSARRDDVALAGASAVASALLWLVAAHRAASGAITVGTIVAVALYQIRIFQSVRRLVLEPMRLPQQELSLVYERIDAAPPSSTTVHARRRGTRALQHLQGRLTFESVSVVSDVGQLQDVSFDIPPGRRLIVVGTARSGQRLLRKLITTEASPDAGAILIDGWPVAEIAAETLQRAFGAFPEQNLQPTAPGTTFRDYLKQMRPNATESQIVAAARAVGLDEVIAALPDGYASAIEFSPRTDSERARLQIARSLLHDPSIIVVEEPMMRSDADRLLDRALTELLRGRTAIVFATRKATLAEAEQIIVLDGGRVAERGSHEDLIAAEGLYSRLYRQQHGDQPRIADVIA